MDCGYHWLLQAGFVMDHEICNVFLCSVQLFLSTSFFVDSRRKSHLVIHSSIEGWIWKGSFVQGDAMRNQKVVRNMNSCQVFPKSVQDTVVSILPNQPGSVTGVPSPSSTPNAGGAAWTQGNNNLLASKKYTANPVLGRDNAQDRVSDDRKLLWPVFLWENSSQKEAFGTGYI